MEEILREIPLIWNPLLYEMGEVIIRGQVIDVEAREIRNENNPDLSGNRFYRFYCDQNVSEK